MDVIWWGLGASFVAGAMTAIGALPVLFGTSISKRASDALLAFAAGVMLSASFFSLIIPAIEKATALHGSKPVSAVIVAAALLIGVAFVAVLNETVPHEHFALGRQGPHTRDIARIWLFVLAITIHNLPEGLAVGVGFGAGDVGGGLSLALGIGLQNAPEGLAVGLALLAAGYSRKFAFLVAGLTGAVEPVAGGIGAIAVSFSELVLPWALSFAAGAMIYVISHEIIPETHRHGHDLAATVGLSIGLVVMMLLDVTLS